MLQVKEIMIKNVVSVKKDAPIYEAIELLRRNHISSMPVVEDDLTLIGVLSERDVISLFCYAHEDDEEKVVADFMAQSPVHFNEDESLLSICDCLIVNSFKSIPITSEGKVVGIVSRADILDYILHLREEEDIVLAEQPDK
ncbi:MAG: CBS domain-containing protein [Planctomycetota bacterium]|jgi:CBS domain-containing protein